MADFEFFDAEFLGEFFANFGYYAEAANSGRFVDEEDLFHGYIISGNLFLGDPYGIIGRMISKDKKAEAIKKLARSEKDVGSPEVQVAILTERIKEVTEHVKSNKHDFMARRGLMQMVGKRKKLLKYLEKTDFELYKDTVAKLGLRK